MSLNVTCDECGEYLNQPGGLIFTPPDEDGRCVKYHICLSCFWRFIPAPRGSQR